MSDILPEKLHKKEVKNSIENRAEFNKLIASSKRFAKKGSEQVISNDYGLRVTKYEKREVALKLAIINRRRTAQREMMGSLEVFSQGKAVGQKRAEMGSIRMNELNPKKYTFSKTRPEDYREFVKSVEKQAKINYLADMNELYKENYLKALEDFLPENARFIYDAVAALPAEELIKRYYSEQEAYIKFMYEPHEIALKLEVLAGIWTDYDEGTIRNLFEEIWEENPGDM